jgi:hypothetical protein
MLPSGEFDGQRVECGLLFPLIWGRGLGALPAFHLTIEARGRLFGLGNVGNGNKKNKLGMFGLSQTSTSLQ